MTYIVILILPLLLGVGGGLLLVYSSRSFESGRSERGMDALCWAVCLLLFVAFVLGVRLPEFNPINAADYKVVQR